MKRKFAIAALVLTLVMLFAQVAYADSLSIVKTVPDDGETGKQPANLAVKIVFSEDMSEPANDKLNASCVSIKDADGKSQELELDHHEKYPNELWFILKSDLVTNTEYKVTVNSGIKSTAGNTLASASSFTFKTRNTKTDNSISIGLSLGMMAIMLFATTKSVKKAAEQQAGTKKSAGTEKLEQTNPYRLAKEQGISIDEAKAIIAKEQGKLNKKNASVSKAREKYEKEQAAREAEIERRLKEIHDASVYKVKGPGSLKAHGKALPKSVVKKLEAQKKAKKK